MSIVCTLCEKVYETFAMAPEVRYGWHCETFISEDGKSAFSSYGSSYDNTGFTILQPLDAKNGKVICDHCVTDLIKARKITWDHESTPPNFALCDGCGFHMTDGRYYEYIKDYRSLNDIKRGPRDLVQSTWEHNNYLLPKQLPIWLKAGSVFCQTCFANLNL